ncbi:MAG: hypothetical protein R3231_10415 [bacterium]|nr:hypothetical protein [bacterium]
MVNRETKSVYWIQIAMVFFFNIFILGFFSWFFFLIRSAKQLNESAGPGTGLATVAIPIAGILLWVVNYTAYGLLKDETASLFRGQKTADEERECPPQEPT